MRNLNNLKRKMDSLFNEWLNCNNYTLKHTLWNEFWIIVFDVGNLYINIRYGKYPEYIKKDAVADAIEWLINSIQNDNYKHNKSRGMISNYFCSKIKFCLIDQLTDNIGIKVSSYIKQHAFQIKKILEEHQKLTGLTYVSHEKIAEELGISKKTALYALNYLEHSQPLTLSTPITSDSKIQLEETITDTCLDNNFIDRIIAQELQEIINNLIGEYNNMTCKRIIMMSLSKMKGKDIAKECGVSPPYVTKVYSAFLKKLKLRLNEFGYEI